jgi:histidyl-tRNA synthetase
LEEVLGSLGVKGDLFAQTCIVVDKMDKLSSEVIKEQLSELGHSDEVISKIQSVLGIKDMESLKKSLDKKSSAISELNTLFDLIDSYGMSEWVEFDASIVRGLAYYTGSVFEAHDREGKFRAICGGGRYDNLLSTLGGKDLPATGFGFGDMVIMELLSEKGLIPELISGVDDIVLPLSQDLRDIAVRVAASLRLANRTVDLVLEDKKIKWAFKHAERIGARRLVLLAPDEWSRKMIKVKDLETGEEKEVSLKDL